MVLQVQSHLQQVLAGTYTVTYTYRCSRWLCRFYNNSFCYNNCAPSATISYAGPFCTSNATPQTVTLTGTTGGTYSSTPGLTINGATGAITPSTSTRGNIYSYLYNRCFGRLCYFYNNCSCNHNCCSRCYDQLCWTISVLQMLHRKL